jgi:hypothetical protein
MMRIAWIELRRSNARVVGLLIVVLTWVALLIDVHYWDTQWTRLANYHASAVFVLLPIALAGGAMLGRRERRTRADELLGSTGRPRWQRITPAMAAMAVAVVLAHLFVFAAGGVLVARMTDYTSGTSMIVPVADSVILVGGAWLGFAAGRSWTSPLLPPALAAVGLLGQLGLSLAEAPGQMSRLDNLILVPQPPIYDWETVTGRAILGHLALGAGLAAAGFLLAAARRWPARIVAVPVVVGAILAAALIPGVGQAGRYRVDHAAQRLVCSGAVCVTAVHQTSLATIVPQAGRALTLLAKLPGAPTKAVEWRAATVYIPGEADPAAVPVGPGTIAFTLDQETGQPGRHLVEDLVWGAGAPQQRCRHADEVGLAAAGAWLLGTDAITTDDLVPEATFDTQVRDTVQALRRAPAAEQTRRVTALRDAATACKPGLTSILTGKDHG